MKAKAGTAAAAVSSSSELSADTLDAMVTSIASAPILLDETIGVAYLHTDAPSVSSHVDSPTLPQVMMPVPSEEVSQTNCAARVIARASVPIVVDQTRLTVSVSYVQETSLLYVSINDRMCLEVIVDLSSALGLESASDKAMISLSAVGPSSDDGSATSGAPLLLIPLEAKSLSAPIQTSAVLHRWDFSGKERDSSSSGIDGVLDLCTFCGNDVSLKTIPVAALVVTDCVKQQKVKGMERKIWTSDGKCNNINKAPPEVIDLVNSDNDSPNVGNFFSSAAEEEASFKDDDDDRMPHLERTDERPFLSDWKSDDNDKIKCSMCTFDNPKNAARCEMCTYCI
jgi:hypothetical protein